MAGTSLLALIDDIATLLDDVSVMTKVAAKKTAGVLGDDLALNAQQVTGVKADRELPVVWAVAKGSMVNKAILVPAALLISAFMPVLITPLLMLGGLFLCYEGVEKVMHSLGAHKKADAKERAERVQAVADQTVDLVAFEKEKIKGAVRTDFILSAEIIVISLGTVASATMGQRVGVLVGISLLMTVGVYGLVAGIVKLDDLGLHLNQQAQAWKQAIGRGILAFAPWLMKALSVLGTAAMFLVGGGIVLHGLPLLAHGVEAMAETMGWLGAFVPSLAGALVGIASGAVIVAVVTLVKRLRGAPKAA
ncbi:MAG: DUF808 domain-containing protein [Hydrogenophaga sp.]|nr:DUF808 domain-containing protein [Hydrogenophaga sp.]